MTGLFTLELVQAVSDWQRGPTERTKIARGERLKALMLTLPAYFRECNQLCFRQECHQKDRTFQVLIQNSLPETIASWTTSLDVAKGFKGGVVYGNDDRSIILSITPPNGAVVANLDRLYQEREFQQALEKYGSQIDYFQNGAGKYGNTQKEVVLELGSLSSTHIYSYGGYSSTLDDLVGAFVLERGREPDDAERSHLSGLAGQPWWLSEEATWRMLQRAVSSFEAKIDELLGRQRKGAP
ncbi:hypothetical protein [Methylobacterium sp. AMS5]|uniref:hypothetical protein n=1 Tax=Methylobacterium sp. AMS5 TaxID=925818 RepID=UPI00074F98C1|nr:hypothetical protein [Methylobacterium sp. AMS5]AMB47686.1 hypothetical protein Y590_22290 [Methylobacterium sp. AMS5]